MQMRKESETLWETTREVQTSTQRRENKLVAFDKRVAARGVKQGTFDFLGLHFIGKVSRQDGCSQTENESQNHDELNSKGQRMD